MFLEKGFQIKERLVSIWRTVFRVSCPNKGVEERIEYDGVHRNYFKRDRNLSIR
jgi:hypothetical protein